MVADVLREDGDAVYAVDLRGHGRTADSTGRGRIGPCGMDGVLDDIDVLVRRARAEVGDVAVVLLGHSMGSVVVQAYVALRGADSVDGYALSGTMGLTEGTPEFRDGLRLAMEAGLGDEPLDADRRGRRLVRVRTHRLRLVESRRGRGRQVHRRSALRGRTSR